MKIRIPRSISEANPLFFPRRAISLYIFTFLASQDTAKQSESLDTCCLRLIPCRY